jgi:hypothetical protein
MVRTQIGPGPGKYLLPPLVGYKDHDPSTNINTPVAQQTLNKKSVK